MSLPSSQVVKSKWTVPTLPMWSAFGRHVITFAAGGVTVGAGVAAILYNTHTITQDQVVQATGAFQGIGDGLKTLVSGVTSIVGGIATLVGIASGIYASYTAAPSSQAQSLVTTLPGTQIVGPPSLAASAPSSAVMSETDVKVVPASSPSAPVKL